MVRCPGAQKPPVAGTMRAHPAGYQVGRCPSCGRVLRVRQDGVVSRHGRKIVPRGAP